LRPGRCSSTALWTRSSRSRRDLTLLTGLVLLAAAARIAPLTENRFHPDEALYANWGLLIANGRDVLLAGVPLDKPPLWFYVLAGSFGLFGNSELAARLPALAASLLSVALTYQLSRQLCLAPAAEVVAASVMALSPFSILFGITAFTDPLLVLWLLAALVAAARARLGWAGLCFGLALATKQTALVFAPLLAALAIQCRHRRHLAPVLLRFVAGFAPVVLALLTWDAARHAPAGYWQQSIASYGGLSLVKLAELPQRLAAWGELSSYLLGSPVVTGIFVLAILALLAVEIGQPAQANKPGASIPAFQNTQHRRIVLTLAAFVLGYVVLHAVFSFNEWDRYLLGLVPLLALLVARAAWQLAMFSQRLTPARAAAWQHAAVVVPIILLVGPAWQAAHSGYPIGGDHGAYDGIDRVADYLRHMPWGTVLYDHWLNWELRYYLYDGPIYVDWFSTPEELATDLRAFRDSIVPRYLLLPGWELAGDVTQAVAAAGYQQQLVLTTTRRDGQLSFLLYRVKPANQIGGDADGP